jgi:hypothetical protein
MKKNEVFSPRCALLQKEFRREFRIGIADKAMNATFYFMEEEVPAAV